MNTIQRIVVALVLAMSLFVSGCGPGQLFGPALTPTPTVTTTPVFTATPTVTATPMLTATPTFTATTTSKPTTTPTSTPASVGETIKSGELEITLLRVETHDLIVPGGYYYYYSKPGEFYIDVGVLVRNTGNKPVEVLMGNVYITEETGKSWFPMYGMIKTVETGRRFDPISSLKLEDQTLNGSEKISFQDDTYLRLIFYVKEDQNILFSIQDFPKFTFHVKKK